MKRIFLLIPYPYFDTVCFIHQCYIRFRKISNAVTLIYYICCQFCLMGHIFNTYTSKVITNIMKRCSYGKKKNSDGHATQFLIIRPIIAHIHFSFSIRRLYEWKETHHQSNSFSEIITRYIDRCIHRDILLSTVINLKKIIMTDRQPLLNTSNEESLDRDNHENNPQSSIKYI